MNTTKRVRVALVGMALVVGWSSQAAADGSVVRQAVKPHEVPSMPAPDPLAAADAQALWNRVGCCDCHGEGGPYEEKIKGALGKPVGDVAKWIRNAPSIKPDTDMPRFADVLQEPQALALAQLVQARAARMP